jgi:hypothetical protein
VGGTKVLLIYLDGGVQISQFSLNNYDELENITMNSQEEEIEL